MTEMKTVLFSRGKISIIMIFIFLKKLYGNFLFMYSFNDIDCDAVLYIDRKLMFLCVLFTYRTNYHLRQNSILKQLCINGYKPVFEVVCISINDQRSILGIDHCCL